MSARTSYSHLTESAGRALADALRRPELEPRQDLHGTARCVATDAEPALAAQPEANPGALHAAASAHADLLAALAHLGRVLTRPPGVPGEGSPRAARRHGPGSRLLRDLERRGRARDWTDPTPEPGTAARDLRDSARLIRAAADLWVTHTTLAGAPRSPEASRMRHPSVLGAATREWQELVNVAGRVAAAIVRRADSSTEQVVAGDAHHSDVGAGGRAGGDPAGVGGTAPSLQQEALLIAVEAFRAFPTLAASPTPTPSESPTRGRGASTRGRGASTRSRVASTRSRVDIGLARPGRRPVTDPITGITDAVDRLHRLAWILAERGTGSIPALANFAAIGVLISEAALAAHARHPHPGRAPAGAGPDLSDLRPLRELAAAWSEVAAELAPLRSPHPATTSLQRERAEVAAMVQRMARLAPAPETAAAALQQACLDYREVAVLNLRALQATSDRGDLYVAGGAITPEALRRRPDLLAAKLGGGIVAAPEGTIRQAESAYQSVMGAGTDTAADRNPPAA